MSDTRSNRFLSVRYLEYHSPESYESDGDSPPSTGGIHNPFQFGFLYYPDITTTTWSDTSVPLLNVPMATYTTCIWRIATYQPFLRPISIYYQAWDGVARSGQIAFDTATSGQSSNVANNTNHDIFFPNTICSPPPVAEQYPSNEYLFTGNSNNPEIRAVFNTTAMQIQLRVNDSMRCKGHLTIF